MSLTAGSDSLPLAHPPGERVDVIVAGAGIVGLALAIGLARSGVETAVAGRVAPPMPGRTVALLEGSIRLLERLGLWSDLAARSEPLRTMRLVDDTGSLFRVPPVEFQAEEIGRAWFGCNIENDRLVDSLRQAAAATPGLRLIDRHVATVRFGREEVSAQLDDGVAMSAALIAAADGRHSPTRTAAGLSVKSWRYPQTALTALLAHGVPHRGVSTEFHTRQGPFTLVPLPADPARPGAPLPYRSSLVWVMSPEEAERRAKLDAPRLAEEIERQSRRLLGRVALDGPIGRFPIAGLISDQMAAPRLALLGEAAHAMPPIGAQGLNLGFRDVAALIDHVGAAHRRRQDLGSMAVLAPYGRGRRGDVASRTIGVDWLNRSLLSDWLPVDALRGAGLLALGSIGPLRRFAMRQGLTSAIA